jgi:hypothetical protein
VHHVFTAIEKDKTAELGRTLKGLHHDVLVNANLF